MIFSGVVRSPFTIGMKSLTDVILKDDPNKNDFARFVVYKNDKKLDGIFLYDDRLTNGNYIDFFFFNFDDEEEFNSSVPTISIHTLFEISDEQVFKVTILQ